MRVSIFGLGYVGTTSMACLANLGHEIIGVDIDNKKIELINSGKSPVAGTNLELYIKKARKNGMVSATNNYVNAVMDSDISLITVGTPVLNNGVVKLNSVYSVFNDIGEGIKNKNEYHVIVLRSTVPPGTTRKGFCIIENVSGKKLGYDFGGCMNPEFMREGKSVEDFYNPPFIVIGESDKKSGDVNAKLYKGINSEFIRTEIEIAEMLKYVCNSFHALKISFTNEIGRISKNYKIDSRKIMDIFVKDDVLNISSAYLRPGFAFGGSCLPKDIRAITNLGKEKGIRVPVLEAIWNSNNDHINYAVEKIKHMRGKNIGILGLTFKEGVDDLRESQVINLVLKLIELGYNVKLFDSNVKYENLIGSNKEFIESLSFNLDGYLLNSIDELISFSDIIVIAQINKLFIEPLQNCDDKHIFDLVGLFNWQSSRKNYEGVCW